MKMKFGKYKGLELYECPDSYLSWLQKQDWIDQNLRLALIGIVPENTEKRFYSSGCTIEDMCEYMYEDYH